MIDVSAIMVARTSSCCSIFLFIISTDTIRIPYENTMSLRSSDVTIHDSRYVGINRNMEIEQT